MSEKPSKKRLLQWACLISAALMGTNAGAVDDAAAQLSIANSAVFRILQLTDLHFFSRDSSTWEEFNQRTVDNMNALVKHTSPHLVMITGDVWSEDQNGLGLTHLQYAIKQFETLGVPWAFTWGNHDQVADADAAHRILTEARNSLYRGAQSGGNYLIDILDTNGRRLWQLLCVNTHRDGMCPEQPWVRRLPQVDVPRFAFFHIPLKQYDDVWKNGSASGIWGEDVCMEKEDGSTLPILRQAGVIACFCGHDHQNDYSGNAGGVELVYGRVSRAGGYGADTFNKGGKLITVDCGARRFVWESVTPGGIRWKPKPGERSIMTN